MRRLSLMLLLCCSAALLFSPPAAAQWSLVAEYSQVDGSPITPGHEGELPEVLPFAWGLAHAERLEMRAFWSASVTAADVGRTYEATLDNFNEWWFQEISFWSNFEVADTLAGHSFDYPIVWIADRTVPIDRVTITVDDWRAFIREGGQGVAQGAITARFYTAIPEPATACLALVALIGSLMSRHRPYSG